MAGVVGLALEQAEREVQQLLWLWLLELLGLLWRLWSLIGGCKVLLDHSFVVLPTREGEESKLHFLSFVPCTLSFYLIPLFLSLS